MFCHCMEANYQILTSTSPRQDGSLLLTEMQRLIPLLARQAAIIPLIIQGEPLVIPRVILDSSSVTHKTDCHIS
jgi:hypothetical protein